MKQNFQKACIVWFKNHDFTLPMYMDYGASFPVFMPKMKILSACGPMKLWGGCSKVKITLVIIE